MALFSSLSERLNHIFSKMTKHGKLTALEIKEAMREIRVALLEADVNFTVAKNFIAKVSELAVGEDILKSLTPTQQVIKIVRDNLIELMGGENQKLNVSPKPPTIIMMCGLQGSGKTTLCGKLALKLKKEGKKPLLVACDIYRPAAIDQLKVLGKSIQIDVFERGTQNPVKTCKEAIAYAEKFALDTVIIDTAGRLQIDEKLMDELKEIKKAINPTEILLVIDAMIGQEAVAVSKAFNDALDVTGVVLTKIDGDTRGGAALSIRSVIGKPIKFVGVGEKLTDLEPFYPDRMASRILGMGDVLTLIDKAQEAVDEQTAKELERKFKENSFDLNDYIEQVNSLKKMGGLKSVLSMMPGLGGKLKQIEDQIDEKALERNKAIIQSMTPKERGNPDIINGSRRQRIAKGAGVQVSDVNQLIKQFNQSKEMMRMMKNPKAYGGKMAMIRKLMGN
ncbi:MAG TPA: signal recognition particle protein [Candidatus Onthoplasma faecigallinarum]|nr:signal recognition particle protein [Candidatus Onthoplasma faecigallinarum]